MEDGVIELTTNNLTSPKIVEVDFRRPSIYKIPEDIKKVNPKAFKPQLVSFGPYHHGEVHLRAMEMIKLKDFYKFQRIVNLSIQDIVKSVWGGLKDLQSSYDELDDKWRKEPAKFLELMIRDGCYMLRLLLCGVDSIDMVVLRDMLLLENQLPMTLLNVLYSMVPNQKKDEKAAMLMLCNCEHLLDMYRLELFDMNRRFQSVLHSMLVGQGHEIQLAARFRKAGIKIKHGPTNFDKKQGVLSLPFVEMNAHVESALLNAMAFEKIWGCPARAGSSIILMGNLMEKDEVESFNQLAKGEVLDMWSDDTLVHNKVRKHCNRPWRIWWTTLKDTNFQNPWTMISTLAAFFGFVLLILQTLYAMYGYYTPHSS